VRRFERDSDVLVLVLLGAALVWALGTRVHLTRQQLIFFAVLIPSIMLHEISHGVVALAFGDDTAKRAGRLTLNPIAHIDPFGTIILPALLILSGGRAFGFAKPVPVNVNRLRHPRNQGLLVSLAGPATNLILVVLATVTYRVWRPAGTVQEVVLTAGVANVVLAVFNLIPIPPLDGSAVLERLMPASWWPGYLRFRQYSMPLLLVLFLLRPGIFGRILEPAISAWSGLAGIRGLV
jgi:Zn-dependent protease